MELNNKHYVKYNEHKLCVNSDLIRKNNPSYGKISCSEVMEGSQPPITSWPCEVIKSPSWRPYLTKVDELFIKQEVYCSVSSTNMFSSDSN